MLALLSANSMASLIVLSGGFQRVSPYLQNWPAEANIGKQIALLRRFMEEYLIQPRAFKALLIFECDTTFKLELNLYTKVLGLFVARGMPQQEYPSIGQWLETITSHLSILT